MYYIALFTSCVNYVVISYLKADENVKCYVILCDNYNISLKRKAESPSHIYSTEILVN